jgi:hypothetical protein
VEIGKPVKLKIISSVLNYYHSKVWELVHDSTDFSLYALVFITVREIIENQFINFKDIGYGIGQ